MVFLRNLFVNKCAISSHVLRHVCHSSFLTLPAAKCGPPDKEEAGSAVSTEDTAAVASGRGDKEEEEEEEEEEANMVLALLLLLQLQLLLGLGRRTFLSVTESFLFFFTFSPLVEGRGLSAFLSPGLRPTD